MCFSHLLTQMYECQHAYKIQTRLAKLHQILVVDNPMSDWRNRHEAPFAYYYNKPPCRHGFSYLVCHRFVKLNFINVIRKKFELKI